MDGHIKQRKKKKWFSTCKPAWGKGDGGTWWRKAGELLLGRSETDACEHRK